MMTCFRKASLVDCETCGLLDSECYRSRADVSKVKIGRETARAVAFGMIAILNVVRELVLNEFFEQAQAFARAAFPLCNRFNRTIDIPPFG